MARAGCYRVLVAVVAAFTSLADEPGSRPATDPSSPAHMDVQQAAAAAREWVAKPAEQREILGLDPELHIEYWRYERPRPLRLWIVPLNVVEPELRCVVTEPADFTSDEDPANDHFETRSQTTLEFARQYGVQIAINTAAFGPIRAGAGEPVNIAGLAAARGRVYSQELPRHAALFITRDKRCRIGSNATHSSQPTAVDAPAEAGTDWHIVPGFRLLLDDGKIVVDAEEASTTFGGVNPRTAVGIDREGRQLTIVVADGREPAVSEGLTLIELAVLFESLGCWDALNLDGGGSSTLVAQTRAGALDVLNSPMNDGQPGKLRPVGQNLGFYMQRVRQPPWWTTSRLVDGVPADITAEPILDALHPDLAGIPLHEFSEADLDAYLPALQLAQPDLPQRVLHLARKNLGQPYQIFLLGEFPLEEHDPDPLYNLRRSDCLTHVEHIYAAALADSFAEYVATLQRIRYREGRIGMLTRNHYTEADWNPSNSYLFDDITTTLGHGQVHVPLTSTIRRAAFFKQFGLGQGIPIQPFRDAYIPKRCIPEVLPELRAADVVNIVRGNAKEQYVGHVGLIVPGCDGAMNFLHSGRPVVQEEPLLTYLDDDPRALGVKILRPRPDAPERMAEARQAPDLAAQLGTLQLDGDGRRGCILRQHLQAMRLDAEEPVSDGLQTLLEATDTRVRGELPIRPEQRAFGVVDLSALSSALLEPDRMFYGASVPSVAILLAYFAQDPARAADLPPTTLRELERMIKRSDPELAAKYGQMVGLDFIQRTLQSDGYALYDPSLGGGLWYGEHFGIDEPRRPDPLLGLSHAVTVRQCLRYYLLMEQGRLVNRRVSEKIREIFAASEPDFSNDHFVRGLNGRPVTLIRKNGLWEGWHLDMALVTLPDRKLILAGAVCHKQGGEYLARMAQGLVDHWLPTPSRVLQPKHATYRLTDAQVARMQKTHTETHDLPEVDTGDVRRSADAVQIDRTSVGPTLEPDFSFQEALVSWNIDRPTGLTVNLQMRVGRHGEKEEWSGWLPIAEWAPGGATRASATRFAEGTLDVDHFRSEEYFDELQVRYRLAGTLEQARDFRVQRLDVTVSDRLRMPGSGAERTAPRDRAAWSRVRPGAATVPGPLDVPYYSQRAESPEIADRICSPTSLAMVMAYRGVRKPVAEVAAAVYDPAHDIYGNWPRNVQAAYGMGVPGYLTRIGDWQEVQSYLASGTPLIISIRFAREGALRGAPYDTTAGHLLVITGLEADGSVCVNDPAAVDEAHGRTRYAREDLEVVWMRNTGGVAYVLLPKVGAQ